MKACSYCGKQNTDEQNSCSGCGLELVAAELPALKEKEPSSIEIFSPRASSLLSAGFFKDAEPLDISQIDMGYSFDEGFSRADWKRIGGSIRNIFPKELWPQAWRDVVVKWVNQLREDLGGAYQVYESWNFLLLSAETKTESESMLKIAETAVQVIESQMGSLLSGRALFGKRVILAFNEQDDYYTYISNFYPDGHHSFSSGLFIRKGGYAHIALPYPGLQSYKPIIFHELTHNCLMALRLPIWLNEGFSRRMETGGLAPRIILDRDLAKEHHAFWNEQNIQEFWAGTSFYRPDEGNKLSYSLGEILVELLSSNWPDFLNFVNSSDWKDGGQDAALKCLDCCLGDTVARFLGPGQWRPNRKLIADLWEKRKRESSGASE